MSATFWDFYPPLSEFHVLIVRKIGGFFRPPSPLSADVIFGSPLKVTQLARGPVEDGGRPLADCLLGVAEAVDCRREDGVDVVLEGDPEALDQQAHHVQAVLGHLKLKWEHF